MRDQAVDVGVAVFAVVDVHLFEYRGIAPVCTAPLNLVSRKAFFLFFDGTVGGVKALTSIDNVSCVLRMKVALAKRKRNHKKTILCVYVGHDTAYWVHNARHSPHRWPSRELCFLKGASEGCQKSWLVT